MRDPQVVVVGLDVQLADGGDVDAFARRIYAGEIDADAFDGEEAPPLSAVIDGALVDAAVPPGAEVAVLVVDGGAGAPPTLSAALVAARRLLIAGEAEAAVIAAGEVGCAGAVVLQRAAEAAAAPRRYAVLEATALTEDEKTTPEAVMALHRRAWAQTPLTVMSPGYLELAGDADPRRESAALAGLRRTYHAPTGDLTCGLGSLAAGDIATPTVQLAGFIKTVLCLHQRFIPAQPHWQGPAAPERWQGTPFYVDVVSRPWFVPSGEQRVAAFYAPADAQGPGGVAVLTDTPSPRRDSRDLQHAATLLPLAAQGQSALLARLKEVRAALTDARTPAELRTVARHYYEAYRRHPEPRYTLCLVGKDREALLREADFALAGVTRAFETHEPWQTPRGSYFTPRPLAQEGTLAFVYPGAFNAYPELGRHLFRLFPQLHARFAETTSNLGEVVGERALYPRSLTPLSRAERRAHERALLAQPATLIEAGTTFAMLFTSILRDNFGVQPVATLGYSLGEASMLWANGVWQDVEAGRRAWRDSPLFTTRLAGPKEAVREAWGIAPSVADDAFWRTYLLKAPVEAIQERVAEEPHVELTMINTPEEGVIGGEPAGCRRVIEALDCHALPAPYDAVIHTESMRSERAAFVELYTHPVARRPAIDFYSAAGYAPLTLEPAALARALADMTCHPVDFPRLVQRAYADGARLFVELGPQRTCTRWIDKILVDKPHAAMAIDKKGAADVVQIFGVLAQLLSHSIDVTIDSLYEDVPEAQKAAVRRTALAPVHAGREAPAVGHRAPSETAPLPAAFDLVRRAYEGATVHRYRVAEAHGAFLQARHRALRETGELIRQQIDVYRQWLERTEEPNTLKGDNGQRSARFNEADLRAFATGSPEQCFGPAYAAFAGRRLPRLPNGDLLLISRIREVTGEAGALQPGASLVAEYDVPPDAWFYRQNAAPLMPYAVLMEIALQPCGFLSAYLESALRHPESDFYFRNLDGVGHLLSTPDLRGRTVVNRVRLLSSATLSGVILQQFTFSLACEGETFYEGEASFGYFEASALANQVGLDGGRASQPWYHQANVRGERLDFSEAAVRQRYYGGSPTRPHYRLAGGQLDLLDRVYIVPEGGEHGRGYVYAEAAVDPRAWFFKCHFYQDPVMPGSLGVQAIQQALQTYAIHQGLGAGLRHPTFTWIADHQMTWTYRGQIRPEDETLALEVHVREIQERPGAVTLVGDAGLWNGERRIYAVDDVGFCIRERS
ncbi:MAG: PfaB family protein [Anaerolineae bacterium]